MSHVAGSRLRSNPRLPQEFGKLINYWTVIGRFWQLPTKIVRPSVEFIVLCTARTGSNLMVSLLNSHPNIYMPGEVFENLHGADPYSAIDARYLPRRGKLAIGCKVFYSHPLDSDNKTFWKALLERRELKVIHLTRTNLLRQIVSFRIARKTQVWVNPRAEREVPLDAKRVLFKHHELEGLLHRAHDKQREAISRFENHKVLNITFESLNVEPRAEFERVTRLLGVSTRVPMTHLSRQNPEPLSELLENYDDLYAHFVNTPWAPMFEAPEVRSQIG